MSYIEINGIELYEGESKGCQGFCAGKESTRVCRKGESCRNYDLAYQLASQKSKIEEIIYRSDTNGM